jgi:hypothetical protein
MVRGRQRQRTARIDRTKGVYVARKLPTANGGTSWIITKLPKTIGLCNGEFHAAFVLFFFFKLLTILLGVTV